MALCEEEHPSRWSLFVEVRDSLRGVLAPRLSLPHLLEKDTHKTPATATVEAYPTAKVVPGKPGLVFSPFVNTQAMIDVRDMKSGQKGNVLSPKSYFLFLDSD
jgi:hypothetical protein